MKIFYLHSNIMSIIEQENNYQLLAIEKLIFYCKLAKEQFKYFVRTLIYITIDHLFNIHCNYLIIQKKKN